MSSAKEACSCGATIEVSSDYDARLRTALEEWRAGHQHATTAASEAPKPETAPVPEHQPQGNNFSATERRSNFLEPDELNQQYRPGPYGRAISLKWWPASG